SRTGTGRTIPYADFALARTPTDNRNMITPEFEVASVLDLSDSMAEERRGLGFTDIVAAPGGNIAAGQSALASLSGLPRREAIVKAPVALQIAFRSGGGFGGEDGHDHEDDSLDLTAQLPGPQVAQTPPSPAQTPGPSPSPSPVPSPGPTPVGRR